MNKVIDELPEKTCAPNQPTCLDMRTCDVVYIKRYTLEDIESN